MVASEYKRLAHRDLLRKMGRALLVKVFEPFRAELAARRLALPPPELSDEGYFHSLSVMLLSGKEFPRPLHQAILAVHQLRGPDGRDRVQKAVARAGLALPVASDAPAEIFVLQAWLADPDLVSRERLMLFDEPLNGVDIFSGYAPRAERSPVMPALGSLSSAVDGWLEQQHCGRHTTRIEQDSIWEGETLFDIRHGAPSQLAPTVEGQETVFIPLQPEVHDTIIYSAREDELRISAKNKEWRDFYRALYGACLHGDANHFSRIRTYTLEPLRSGGRDTLDVRGLPGIEKITLRALDVDGGNGHHLIIRHSADDLSEAAAVCRGAGGFISKAGKLVHAVLGFQFTDSLQSWMVEIGWPNILKFQRLSDLHLVLAWIAARGLRGGG